MATNTGNTFIKPSTGFTLLRHTLPMQMVCFKPAGIGSACVCLRFACKPDGIPSTSHLGDTKLARANLSALIFVLMVTSPSAEHPVPPSGREIKRRGLLCSQALGRIIFTLFYITSTLYPIQWGAQITPQGHSVAATITSSSVAFWSKTEVANRRNKTSNFLYDERKKNNTTHLNHKLIYTDMQFTF